MKNNSEAPIISFKNVTFSFGSNIILQDVTFDVFRDESLCVIGPNGGGKTTLLKLILGEYQPNSGSIQVFGKSPKAALPKVSYMSQTLHTDPLFPICVMDVVLMGRLQSVRWGGFYKQADIDAAHKTLQSLGVDHLRDKLFGTLSGGQRQRVLLARSLVVEPELLLLDEPTNNIDVQVEAQLLELLHQLKQKMTILMVSHDVGFVSSMVQRVLCVHKFVSVHPTVEVKDTFLKGMYGTHVRAVRHDTDLTTPDKSCKECGYHE